MGLYGRVWKRIRNVITLYCQKQSRNIFYKGSKVDLSFPRLGTLFLWAQCALTWDHLENINKHSIPLGTKRASQNYILTFPSAFKNTKYNLLKQDLFILCMCVCVCMCACVCARACTCLLLSVCMCIIHAHVCRGQQ